jgi:asparagine N-glycosylation enzyme membrane subunit Stt3
MGKLTLVFGLILVVIGISGYYDTGHIHPTALIPAYIGGVVAVCGFLAITEDAKRRMLWMHIAVTVGALGFLFTIPGLIDMIRMAFGTVFPHPVAVMEKAGTSLVCLIFVAFCVRSFVNARKARAAV